MDEPIRRELVLAAPIDAVWGVVATSEGLASWLGGSTVEVDVRADAPILVRWPDGSTSRGLVEDVVAPRRFVFRWRRLAGAGSDLSVGPATRVTIELEHDGEQRTRVVVTETPGWPATLQEALR